MNTFKTIAVATMATALSLGSVAAIAADPIATLPYPETVVEETVNHNFNGPYVGIGALVVDNHAAPYVSAGVDARHDVFVVGAEVYSTVGSDPVFGLDGKAGVVLTDNVSVYGIAGIQTSTLNEIEYNSFGIGTDIALTEDVALTGSYRQVYDFGTFDHVDDQYRVGLKFSF